MDAIFVEFDVLLPTVIFFVVTVSVFLYQKLENEITALFEERKLMARDAVLMVIAMGIMVTVIAFVPTQAIKIVVVAAYSYMMFSFTYIAVKRWYFAIFPPVIFIVLYVRYWELFAYNLFVFNLFAAIFAVIATVYMGTLFSWRTTLIYAGLLTVMDAVQVFGTGFMGEAAAKMVDVLALPVAFRIPAYPAVTWMMFLGLGDVFLSGLLAIQTASKHGRGAGLLTAATVGVAMFIFEVIALNTTLFVHFPATLVVVAGWVMGLGGLHLVRLRKQPFGKAEKAEEESL